MHKTKFFFVPFVLLLINGCNRSSVNGISKDPIYPPAPPPPFRFELKPTTLFSNPEADFTCMMNEKKPHDVNCWGDNAYGQVTGTGLTSESAGMTVVAGIPKELITIPDVGSFQPEITHVAVGKTHACVGLNTDEIWCWGDNGFGQLSNALTATVHPSTLIGEDSLPYGPTITALTAGNAHTCVAYDDNTIWCWGNNSDGQVSGDGTPDSTPLGFINVTENSNTLPNSDDDSIIALAAGHNFTCALYEHIEKYKNKDGKEKETRIPTVWCWGDNSKGQINGEMYSAKSQKNVPSFPMEATKVEGLPTGEIVSLSAGYDHACVGFNDGGIWCWGNDKNAQVSGIKDTKTTSPGLTLVQGISKSSLGTTSGENFTCSAFKDGYLWCWGDNRYGVIDASGFSGSYKQRITNVSSIHESVVIAAGAHHMCASFTEGDLKCWGNDEKGQVNGKGLTGKTTEHITSIIFE